MPAGCPVMSSEDLLKWNYCLVTLMDKATIHVVEGLKMTEPLYLQVSKGLTPGVLEGRDWKICMDQTDASAYMGVLRWVY